MTCRHHHVFIRAHQHSAGTGEAGEFVSSRIELSLSHFYAVFMTVIVRTGGLDSGLWSLEPRCRHSPLAVPFKTDSTKMCYAPDAGAQWCLGGLALHHGPCLATTSIDRRSPIGDVVRCAACSAAGQPTCVTASPVGASCDVGFRQQTSDLSCDAMECC